MIPKLITAHQYNFFIALVAEMDLAEAVAFGRIVIDRLQDPGPVYYVNRHKVKTILFNEFGHEVPQPPGVHCYQVKHCSTQRDRLFDGVFYPRLLTVVKRRIATLKGYDMYKNGNLLTYSERLVNDILEK